MTSKSLEEIREECKEKILWVRNDTPFGSCNNVQRILQLQEARIRRIEDSKFLGINPSHVFIEVEGNV